MKCATTKCHAQTATWQRVWRRPRGRSSSPGRLAKQAPKAEASLSPHYGRRRLPGRGRWGVRAGSTAQAVDGTGTGFLLLRLTPRCWTRWIWWTAGLSSAPPRCCGTVTGTRVKIGDFQSNADAGRDARRAHDTGESSHGGAAVHVFVIQRLAARGDTPDAGVCAARNDPGRDRVFA